MHSSLLAISPVAARCRRLFFAAVMAWLAGAPARGATFNIANGDVTALWNAAFSLPTIPPAGRQQVTNPLDSSSYQLRVIAIQLSGNNVVITFNGVANRAVRLERKVSLLDANWTDTGVPVTPASTANTQITHIGGVSSATGFYRIACVKCPDEIVFNPQVGGDVASLPSQRTILPPIHGAICAMATRIGQNPPKSVQNALRTGVSCKLLRSSCPTNPPIVLFGMDFPSVVDSPLRVGFRSISFLTCDAFVRTPCIPTPAGATSLKTRFRRLTS